MDNNEQQNGQRRGCPVKSLASKVKIDNYDSLLIYIDVAIGLVLNQNWLVVKFPLLPYGVVWFDLGDNYPHEGKLLHGVAQTYIFLDQNISLS